MQAWSSGLNRSQERSIKSHFLFPREASLAFLMTLNGKIAKMGAFKTPISVLRECVDKFPHRSVLKIPQQLSSGTTFKDILYPAFQKDVELSARYWKHQLSNLDAKDRAVVGVW